MQTFINTFGQLVECVFIDAPHQTGRERFLTMKQKGFKGPYRKWGDYNYHLLEWH
jgi:hypothetical protein